MTLTRKPNTYGGGANTNVNGLKFEQTTSLDSVLESNGFKVLDNKVFFENELMGWSVGKRKLYTKFLKPNGIDYKNYNSKGWEPDECFINETNRTAYIIEKKFQKSSGSVDEKLPGCHFKKLEYKKLFSPIGYKVEFIYIFNDWFKREEYRDTKQYIREMGCQYFFYQVPLSVIGLDFILSDQ